MRGVADRDAGVVLAEFERRLAVAEVVHEPERDAGDLRGEGLDFDAGELVDGDAQEQGDVEHLRGVVLAERAEEPQLEAAQLAVGDDEEVATAAGGIQDNYFSS